MVCCQGNVPEVLTLPYERPLLLQLYLTLAFPRFSGVADILGVQWWNKCRTVNSPSRVDEVSIRNLEMVLSYWLALP